jgi:hypothetical protein
MYSLGKLKLDLTKLVSGPDCKHVSKTVKSLGKQAEAKYVTYTRTNAQIQKKIPNSKENK